MANLTEADEFPSGIYQLETADPVLGGPPNEATKAGIDNVPHQQLAKRTHWLKVRVDQLLATVVAATTTVAGIVRLSSATNSASATMAATPAAVKAANDNANTRALKTTTISTGAGLSGAGDLSANRTISLDYGALPFAEAPVNILCHDDGVYTPHRTTPLNIAQRAANLAGFSMSVGSGWGYITLPNWLGGLKMAWFNATTSGSAGSDGTQVSLPLTFPGAIRVALITDRGNAANSCSVTVEDNSTVRAWGRTLSGDYYNTAVCIFVLGT